MVQYDNFPEAPDLSRRPYVTVTVLNLVHTYMLDLQYSLSSQENEY